MLLTDHVKHPSNSHDQEGTTCFVLGFYLLTFFSPSIHENQHLLVCL